MCGISLCPTTKRRTNLWHRPDESFDFSCSVKRYLSQHRNDGDAGDRRRQERREWKTTCETLEERQNEDMFCSLRQRDVWHSVSAKRTPARAGFSHIGFSGSSQVPVLFFVDDRFGVLRG